MILTAAVRPVNHSINEDLSMRLVHFVTSVPLMLCALPLANPVSFAQAAALDAAQATEMLAKSQAIDVKCSVLAADQSQNLKDFVARAEISLAEKASVSVARKTILAGRTAGKTAVCDDAARKLVNDVLAAANAATAVPIADATAAETLAAETPAEPQVLVSVPAVEPVKTRNTALAVVDPEPSAKVLKPAAPQKKIVIIKPRKPSDSLKATKITKAEKPVKPAKTGKSLNEYASVAEKYYVALRCGSMSRNGVNRLYKNVLANHQQAIAANRPGEVKAMLQAAEARAGGRSCT
jgi:hypothetical protein